MLPVTIKYRSNPLISNSKPLRQSPPPRFCRGALVEVSSFEEGFLGSYYEATVIADLPNGNYIVQYRTLVIDDYSEPLREIVSAAEVRPRPPPPIMAAAEFKIHDVVDVFDNDGWWVGRITGSVEDDYYCVFFDSTGEEICYAKNLLRIHQDWIDGNWMY